MFKNVNGRYLQWHRSYTICTIFLGTRILINKIIINVQNSHIKLHFSKTYLENFLLFQLRFWSFAFLWIHKLWYFHWIIQCGANQHTWISENIEVSGFTKTWNYLAFNVERGASTSQNSWDFINFQEIIQLFRKLCMNADFMVKFFPSRWFSILMTKKCIHWKTLFYVRINCRKI